ncbi:MAG: PAS domain S-box protein, partial [Anaerolineae bacterium]|nr:PAS domain S-box protein [Anaerolineae bacterium]
MAESLRVLVLEDRPEDAELMLRELQRAGYEPDWKCVAAEREFAESLSERWDVILADYVLPEFNAVQALQRMRERGLDVPFILVTGSVGEEVAVDCMQAGAADYVFKDRLARLGPAVQRALERKRARDERRQAVAALRESEAKFRTVFHSSADLITIADIETGIYVDVNDGFLEATGYARDEVIGKAGDDLHLWLEPAQRRGIVRRVSQGQEVRNEEVWFHKKDGTPVIGLLTAEKVEVSGRPCLLCVVRDITERKRMEEALRDSERRYQTLAEMSPMGIFRTDAQGKTTYVNPRWSQISGADPQDALGDGWTQAVHPEDREKTLSGWREAVREGVVSPAEYRFLRPNGTVAWVMGLAVPEVDDQGNVVGYVGTITDITERKRMEEALRESEARFRSLVESMDDIVFTLDREGRHTGVFGRWLQKYGTPPEVYLGKTAREVLGPEAARVHEEANARALAGENAVYEWSAPGADEPLYFQTSVSPLYGPDGQVVGIVGVGRDITALKRAEKALRESEERYRALVNLSPDGIWVHRHGEVLFANDAAVAMFGAKSPEDLIGKQTLDFVAPEMRDIVRERIRRGMEERVPAPLMEEKLLRLDGTEFYADVLAVPIMWGGEPAVQVIIRDSTERKQMEERLLQAQKMEVVGRLAGGIAHDFNNILTAINGYATFALESLSPGDPVRADVEQILASAERAANLTRQLLALSRRQIIEQRVVSLNDLILDLDKMLRRLIGEDIELVVIPGEDLAPVRADSCQIEQVIVNLAVNARDAMPDGGKLIIETANVSLDAEYAQRHPGAQ